MAENIMIVIIFYSAKVCWPFSVINVGTIND